MRPDLQITGITLRLYTYSVYTLKTIYSRHKISLDNKIFMN